MGWGFVVQSNLLVEFTKKFQNNYNVSKLRLTYNVLNLWKLTQQNKPQTLAIARPMVICMGFLYMVKLEIVGFNQT